MENTYKAGYSTKNNHTEEPNIIIMANMEVHTRKKKMKYQNNGGDFIFTIFTHLVYLF